MHFKEACGTHLINTDVEKVLTFMGVSRLFSKGWQNFPREVKTYYLTKKHQKDTIFLKKVQKHTTLAQVGTRARVPSCPPLLRTPMFTFMVYFN